MLKELVADYRDLLPDMPLDEWRRILGEQEIIVHYEPEKAIETLPRLLANPADRERLLILLDRLVADDRVQRQAPMEEQLAMVERVRRVLDGAAVAPAAATDGRVIGARPTRCAYRSWPDTGKRSMSQPGLCDPPVVASVLCSGATEPRG